MSLDLEQLKKIVEDGKNKDISQAIQIESRLKLHNQPNPNNISGDTSYKTFIDWALDLLHPDKHERFKQLFTSPVKTISLTDKIFKEFRRIFSASDAFRRYVTTEETKIDLIKYLNSLGLSEWLKYDAWEIFRNSIHSIIVIDQPAEETSPPAPFWSVIDIKNVFNVGKKENGDITWLIYESVRDDKDVFVVIDDKSYRVYLKKDGEVGKEIVNNPHDLGYCPATDFWKTDLLRKSNILKRSPIYPYLSDLDILLLFLIGEDYADLYGIFPIIWGIEQECSYKTESSECSDGILYGLDNEGNRLNTPLISSNGNRQCPNCEKSRALWAGTKLTIPAGDEDINQSTQPAGFVEAPVASLQNIASKNNSRKESIFSGSTGGGVLEDINKQSQNELQIKAGFEGRKATLIWISENFAHQEKFITDTIGLLRYGSKEYGGSDINYGEKFHLESAEMLKRSYDEDKEKGLPQFVLLDDLKKINEAENKNNKEQLKENDILIKLEPFPTQSITECSELLAKGQININQFTVKLNFVSYVERFKSEHISFETFITKNMTEDKSNDDIILQIKQIINEYEKNDRMQLGTTVSD